MILSLAPSSLSSPTIPPPIHVLLPRHTFLHLGLQEAVFRLQTFAPPTFSFNKRVVEEPETTTTTEPDSDEEVLAKMQRMYEKIREHEKDEDPRSAAAMMAAFAAKAVAVAEDQFGVDLDYSADSVA